MTEMLRSSNEPGLAKVRLRSEITHSLRECSGTPFVMVHDPIHGHFYRLGINEWRLARLFDGQRTLRQVVAVADAELGGEGTSPADVVKLAHWLTQNKLAETLEGSLQSDDPANNAATSWEQPLQQTARLAAWNPLFLKFSLPDPQPLLNAVFPYTSWLFGPLSILVWLGVCVFGCYSVLGQWSQFTSSLHDIFSPDQWLQLLIVWLVLKLFHELGHAVCCMRLGGRVTRWGLMFIMFSPIAWVDVTSAWSFRSKWHRMAVSAAGMYVEFLLAAIAGIVWANTSSPWVATLSRNVVISASLTTLLFNLNCLMRFDGYFILADLIDIQNLYASGQQYLQFVQRRYLLGMRGTPLKFTGAKLRFVQAYGIAALIWRLVFYVGIVIVAAQFFDGAGLVLAVFSGIVWFGLPLAKLCLTLFVSSQAERPNRLRFTAVCSALIVLIAAGLCLPWPGSTRAHGYVEYAPLRTLRADRGGFVRQVNVCAGDQVSAGQVLAQLENKELIRELADLDLQIRIQEIQQRVLHRDDELAGYEAAEERVESLRKQRKQLAEQVESLTVRSPIAGTVLSEDIDSMLGRYLGSGKEILSVGAAEKEIRVCIPQQEVELFREATQQPVQLAIRGHHLPSEEATFSHVTPRATRRILYPALAATAGGPLPVQAATDSEGEEQMLVEASFEGVVNVPATLAGELRVGEICCVSLGRGRRRVYEELWTLGRAYFARKSQG